jgi:hypothetical protein
VGLGVPLSFQTGQAGAPANGVVASCAASIPEVDAKKPARGASSGSAPKLPIATFLPIVGSASPFSSVAGSASAPIELRLDLGTSKSRKPGELLAPTITVANTSKAPVSILAAMDGSYDHARFPYWDVYARDEKTQQVYRWTHAAMRCGNTNAPRAEDHVVIAPGKQGAPKANGWPSALDHAAIAAPGTYTVWVEYAFCGYGVSPLTLGKAEVRSDVVIGRFASNGVLITVK